MGQPITEPTNNNLQFYSKVRSTYPKPIKKARSFKNLLKSLFFQLRHKTEIFSPSSAGFQHTIAEERTFHMCSIPFLRPAASKFRFMHPSKVRWVSTVTPRKSADIDAAEGQVSKTEADLDPIVAFSRPPPVPPILGPLVALSLLDSWLKRDSNDE